jgi:mitochondrial fission protein ELM1
MDISYITHTRNGLNIGARNQALGVVEALARNCGRPGEKVTVREYDVSEMPALAATLGKSTDRFSQVVIGVGDEGVKAFAQLPDNAGYTSVLIGHEVPKAIASVSGKTDLLAVPEHVTDLPELKGVRVIRTAGVSHTMTAEKADAAFAQWKNKFAKSADQPVITVMLGGEVDGKHFDREEVRRLGQYVAQKAKSLNAYVLATSSPRAQPEAIAAFNQGLHEQSCDSAFFPFAKHKDEVPYQALLGAVRAHPGSMVIATGDSVSMPCEAASVLQPEQLTIVHVSNENPQNRNFVEWMNRHGHAAVAEFTASGVAEKPAQDVAERKPLNAAQWIAHVVRTHITPVIDRILGKRSQVYSPAEPLDAPAQIGTAIAELAAAKRLTRDDWRQRIEESRNQEAAKDAQGGRPGKNL